MIGNGIGSQTVAPSNYIAFLWQVNLALWEAKKAVSVEQDAVRSCFCQNCHRNPKNERQIENSTVFPRKGALGVAWTWKRMEGLAMQSCTTGRVRWKTIQIDVDMTMNTIKVCLMGEGRRVNPPTEDTGLRVAWSRRYFPPILLILGIGSVRSISTLQLYLPLRYQWLLPQCLVRCRQEDRSWIHLGNPIGHLPQVNLGLKLVIFSHDKAYPKLTQFLIPLSHGTHPWFAMDLDHWAVAT